MNFSAIKMLVWVTLGVCLTPCFAQEKKFTSEFIGGINGNTAGWIIGGLMLKKSIRVSERAFRTYGIEIMNIKHPQESRTQSYTGNYYIYGKINYLYSLHMQYGRDIILFEKANRSGVTIKLCGAVGLSLGILSPYYIQLHPSSLRGNIEHEKYNPKDPAHSYSKILGPGFLLEGLSESTLYPGVNCKIGFSFETGTIARQIAGFEAGVSLDTFFEKTELLANAEKKTFFPALYITLFYGTRK